MDLGYRLLAKPLHEALKEGTDGDPLIWDPEQEKAFHELKLKLLQAPALGLPKTDKPSQPYTTGKQEVALGIFTQALGPTNAQ